MADYDTSSFERRGFLRSVDEDHPSFERLSVGAGLLHRVIQPHLAILAIGDVSIRRPKGGSIPRQFCHQAYVKGYPDIPKFAVFDLYPHRASVNLYHAEALRPEIWKGAADTGTGVSRHPMLHVLNPGELPGRCKGAMPVDEVRLRLGMAIADVLAAHRHGRKLYRWAGEAWAARVLHLVDNKFEGQRSPDWLHRDGRSKPSLDFYNAKLELAVEVMGDQHFSDVEHFGGKEGRRHRNATMAHKVRSCQAQKVPLLFMRWQTDSLLDGLRRGGTIHNLMKGAFEFSRAHNNRWIDLDEYAGGPNGSLGSRWPGYAFLRAQALPSALDEGVGD